MTPIVGGDGVVALVETDVTVEVLERELGPAAHLAVGNERLRAEAIARLEDVTASRARIVETADVARRRMERDLHDGAQQRMLALTYDLRVALTDRGVRPRTSAPRRRSARRSSARSRRRKSFATSPTGSSRTSWRDPASAPRSSRSPTCGRCGIADELPAGRRYGADVESAAYAVVAEASEDGRPLAVALSEAAGELRVEVEGDAAWDERLVRFEDRVGAAGGSVRTSRRGLEVRLPVS